MNAKTHTPNEGRTPTAEELNEAMVAATSAAIQKAARAAFDEMLPNLVKEASETARRVATETAAEAAVKVSKVNGLKQDGKTFLISLLGSAVFAGAVVGTQKFLGRNKVTALELPATMTQ